MVRQDKVIMARGHEHNPVSSHAKTSFCPKGLLLSIDLQIL